MSSDNSKRPVATCPSVFRTRMGTGWVWVAMEDGREPESVFRRVFSSGAGGWQDIPKPCKPCRGPGAQWTTPSRQRGPWTSAWGMIQERSIGQRGGGGGGHRGPNPFGRAAGSDTATPLRRPDAHPSERTDGSRGRRCEGSEMCGGTPGYHPIVHVSEWASGWVKVLGARRVCGQLGGSVGAVAS